jgi:hypothetical protein
MPKAPDRKRGRPRKFTVNDKVQWVEDGVAPDGSPVQYLQYGLIVEYRQYPAGAFYYVVPLDYKGQLAGSQRRFEAYQLELVHHSDYRDRVSHVAVNNGIDERGCSCQCCAHTSVPRQFFREYNSSL